MIYIGIDVAKNKHACFIVDSNGEILQDNFIFENSPVITAIISLKS